MSMRSITIDVEKLTAYITAAQTLLNASDELLQAIVESTPPEDEWLTPKEAAEITKFSTTFLLDQAKRGKLSGAKVLGSSWRFSRRACEQLFEDADVVSSHMPDRGRRRR